MKKRLIKKISAVFLALIALCFTATVGCFAENDSYITNNGDFTPIYTTSPDSSLKQTSKMSKGESNLFYTQTTCIALFVGYLILFKVKGIDHSEKMHRRNKTFNQS